MTIESAGIRVIGVGVIKAESSTEKKWSLVQKLGLVAGFGLVATARAIWMAEGIKHFRPDREIVVIEASQLSQPYGALPARSLPPSFAPTQVPTQAPIDSPSEPVETTPLIRDPNQMSLASIERALGLNGGFRETGDITSRVQRLSSEQINSIVARMGRTNRNPNISSEILRQDNEDRRLRGSRPDESMNELLDHLSRQQVLDLNYGMIDYQGLSPQMAKRLFPCPQAESGDSLEVRRDKEDVCLETQRRRAQVPVNCIARLDDLLRTPSYTERS